MIMRYAILLGATAAFVIVGLAAVEHVKVAQAQAPAATVDTPAAPQATEPAPPEATPPQDVTAPTAPLIRPTVENPLPENPTPLVNAPPTEPPAPVVTTPAAPAPEKPAVADKNEKSAKQLFGAAKLPTLGKAMAIGYYPRGCLQGGVELPINGPSWQVMRVSRNRNWGHPDLVRFLEKFAPAAAKATHATTIR